MYDLYTMIYVLYQDNMYDLYTMICVLYQDNIYYLNTMIYVLYQDNSFHFNNTFFLLKECVIDIEWVKNVFKFVVLCKLVVNEILFAYKHIMYVITITR